MRHNRKYAIVAVMLATAVYTAQKFQRNPLDEGNSTDTPGAQLASTPDPESRPRPPLSPGGLPVTALIDPERNPPPSPQVATDKLPPVKEPAGQRQERNDDRANSTKVEPRRPEGKKSTGSQAHSEKSPDKSRGLKAEVGRDRRETTDKAKSRPAPESRMVASAWGVTDEGRPPAAPAEKRNAFNGDTKPTSPPKALTSAERARGPQKRPPPVRETETPPRLAERYRPVLEPLDRLTPNDPPTNPPHQETVSPSSSGTSGRSTSGEDPCPSFLIRPHTFAAEGAATAQQDHTNTTPVDTDQERRHRVLPGDTLQQLARRFLGDEKYYLEILCANRQILSTGPRLPIGAELIIPAGDYEPRTALDERRPAADPSLAESVTRQPPAAPLAGPTPGAAEPPGKPDAGVTTPTPDRAPHRSGQPTRPQPEEGKPLPIRSGMVPIPSDTLPQRPRTW